MLNTKFKMHIPRKFPGYGGCFEHNTAAYRVTVLGWLKKEEEDEQF